jgi:hypothetical protein
MARVFCPSSQQLDGQHCCHRVHHLIASLGLHGGSRKQGKRGATQFISREGVIITNKMRTSKKG